ncbi:hypothetical protein [Candidatus Protochlamydia naegleriophila]|nr:hypothetical protein [Candidatus Protochlamydia naegleriophila]
MLKADQWASRSATYRWLGIWQANGTLEKMFATVREQAELQSLLNFERLAADVFFSAGNRGGRLIDYGYKGKGVTTHLLTESH